MEGSERIALLNEEEITNVAAAKGDPTGRIWFWEEWMRPIHPDDDTPADVY